MDIDMLMDTVMLETLFYHNLIKSSVGTIQRCDIWNKLIAYSKIGFSLISYSSNVWIHSFKKKRFFGDKFKRCWTLLNLKQRCLEVIIPVEGLHNLGIRLALMVFTQEGICIVQHLLWYWTAILRGLIRIMSPCTINKGQ